MLLHDGYHHIVFNTVLGLILGVPLETVHKIWRVGPVFLIGVFAGALASSIIDPKTAMVGASGGVYSLIGAHYATVLMNWEELQSDWLKCRSNPLKFLLSGVMTLVYLTLFVGVDFGVAAYRRYALTLKVPMSVSAHVGGMLAGLLVGTPVLRNIDKKPWEGVVSIVAIVAASVLILFGILWNIFYHGYPNSEDVACSNPSIVD
ncbi:hypothetical protein BOX15_Mlig018813g4 [Macrostomum lignano]|nr:hypothetical protein BOX15_Mlig018813g4 [Macrostomum lignano]